MSSNRITPVSQVCEIRIGGTPKRSVAEYWNGGIKWATARDVASCKTRYLTETTETISQEGVRKSVAKVYPKNTIVITARGVGVGDVRMLGGPMAVNQTCYALITKQGTDPHFLYYALKAALERIKAISYGTVFSTITTKSFDSLEIPSLSISEQKGIANVLSCMDDMIELNQEMEKTLHAIGVTIFKQWFIDFEFPNADGKPYRSSGGEMDYDNALGKKIPKGWNVVSLDNVAEFRRGFSYRGSEKSKTDGDFAFVTLNSVKEFGGFKREFSYITSDRVKDKNYVYSGDIVIANTEQTKTGTLLGYPALVEFPFGYKKDRAVFSHHITSVKPKFENLKHYLYHHLFVHQQNAVQYHTGSVIWALDVNNWSKNEKLVLPSKDVLKRFESLMEILFLKSLSNNFEMESLSRIRDSILPKLMSGKIRVPIEVK